MRLPGDGMVIGVVGSGCNMGVLRRDYLTVGCVGTATAFDVSPLVFTNFAGEKTPWRYAAKSVAVIPAVAVISQDANEGQIRVNRESERLFR